MAMIIWGEFFPVEEHLLALHLAYWQVTHWAAIDPGAIAFLGALADSVSKERAWINGLGREEWKVE